MRDPTLEIRAFRGETDALRDWATREFEACETELRQRLRTLEAVLDVICNAYEEMAMEADRLAGDESA